MPHYPLVIVDQKGSISLYRFSSQDIKENLKKEVNLEFPHILMITPHCDNSAEKFICFSYSSTLGNILTLNLGKDWCDQDEKFFYSFGNGNGLKEYVLDELLKEHPPEERILIHHLPDPEIVLDYHITQTKRIPCLKGENDLLDEFSKVYVDTLLSKLPEI
ncbi:MAG: hypothetical protein PHG05_01010 [Candidatus Nanoarchaeia archaeon]|nr:hypothetical protein [Candidatus Nanoarchaeia archaeon]